MQCLLNVKIVKGLRFKTATNNYTVDAYKSLKHPQSTITPLMLTKKPTGITNAEIKRNQKTTGPTSDLRKYKHNARNQTNLRIKQYHLIKDLNFRNHTNLHRETENMKHLV